MWKSSNLNFNLMLKKKKNSKLKLINTNLITLVNVIFCKFHNENPFYICYDAYIFL